MTLNMGEVHHRYEVEDIQLPTHTQRRLQVLGLTKGTSVEVLHIKKQGAMIIKVRGTRFAIGKKISEQIQVEEVTACQKN